MLSAFPEGPSQTLIEKNTHWAEPAKDTREAFTRETHCLVEKITICMLWASSSETEASFWLQICNPIKPFAILSMSRPSSKRAFSAA